MEGPWRKATPKGSGSLPTPHSGFAATVILWDIVFSSPGTNVLGEVLSYPRRRCRRRCCCRCRWRRQFQVKVFVF